MGKTITNGWKPFCNGFKRDHYEKLICVREFLEGLAKYCFNNHFSPDIGTLENNIPPLDKSEDGDKVSTCRALHLSSCISPSAAASTIYDIALNSASSISIGYQHIAEREEATEGGIYKRLTRGYCSGSFTNGKICHNRSLWF